MIGAAVIGLGVGMLHCEGYAKSRHAKLLAVCVKEREEKLGKARKRFGKVDTYKGYKEVLERNDIDVVSVVTPNYTHYQIAMEAIKAGKHVMLEKTHGVNARRGSEPCDSRRKERGKTRRQLLLPIYTPFRRNQEVG